MTEQVECAYCQGEYKADLFRVMDPRRLTRVLDPICTRCKQSVFGSYYSRNEQFVTFLEGIEEYILQQVHNS